MALKIESQAPNFSLPSTDGTIFTLNNLIGTAMVIYFYPKDFTPGCTKEACEFRDQFATFRNLEIPVFGISKDNIATHLRFKQAHQLPFELLADKNGKVAKMYKAIMPVVGLTKRITYLLNKSHKIIAVHDALTGSTNHVHEMIGKIQET